MDTVKFAYMLL